MSWRFLTRNLTGRALPESSEVDPDPLTCLPCCLLCFPGLLQAAESPTIGMALQHGQAGAKGLDQECQAGGTLSVLTPALSWPSR